MASLSLIVNELRVEFESTKRDSAQIRTEKQFMELVERLKTLSQRIITERSNENLTEPEKKDLSVLLEAVTKYGKTWKIFRQMDVNLRELQDNHARLSAEYDSTYESVESELKAEKAERLVYEADLANGVGDPEIAQARIDCIRRFEIDLSEQLLKLTAAHIAHSLEYHNESNKIYSTYQSLRQLIQERKNKSVPAISPLRVEHIEERKLVE